MKREVDFGTKAVKAGEYVSLSIDGFVVSVPKGTSLMRAAKEAGISVPKLCAHEPLEAFGSCRLCLVEIDGRKGTPASCTTPAEEGMVVHTQTGRLKKLRRGVMELYISDHPLDCLTCAANGDCELQDMAGAVGLRDVRYEAGANHFAKDAPKGDQGNPLYLPIDESNPYFAYEPSKCIVCNRCIRACEEVQGTFALTIEGRGFDARVSAGGMDFFSSECVSCGACVAACPTATLEEKSVINIGTPDRAITTTCGYCGVGCSFRAEMRADEVVRMVPSREGGANEGHSCVKGRFAYGYVSHPDRITTPMIRETITEPWKPVSWDEALSFTAARLRDIQGRHGADSIGGITSSRCTNEETYLVQKLVRSVFGNNNVDTCARVCHSPTGYGLGQAFGTSAGTQDFASVDEADAIIVIGANPTDGHPVFGSRLRKRLREGAKLIVIDPRRIDLLATPHMGEAHHLMLRPGTNVAVLTSLAHVILTEGLEDGAFIKERCDIAAFEDWAEFARDAMHSPEEVGKLARIEPETIREAARAYASARNGAIYYGLGVTEHSQGSTAVMALANLAMATGNIGRRGVGVNPLRGQNNVQGSCDMGSFPHEFPGYRHVSTEARSIYEKEWGVSLSDEPGLRIPNMFDAAIDGSFKGLYVQGEDILQSDPDTTHVAAALAAMECVIIHDLFLNETANYGHVFLPGSSFLEKDGTFTNAERRINRVRKVMAPKNGAGEAGMEDWEITMALASKMGVDWGYTHSSEIMDEIARTTPSFAGVSFARLDELGSIQWPCNENAPEGTPIMHVGEFVRGKGNFIRTEYIPTEERTGKRFPLLLTTGRVLSQYNVGAQTRRTANSIWHDEDLLDIHPHDAEARGVRDGDLVRLSSRSGETSLRARLSDRVAPGVVYTTFHHPEAQANVITGDYSDWATNCPEYKVTAVEIAPTNGPSDWQREYGEQAKHSRRVVAAE